MKECLSASGKKNFNKKFESYDSKSKMISKGILRNKWLEVVY